LKPQARDLEKEQMSDAPLNGQQFLFQPSEFPPLDDLPAEPKVKPFDRPVWTDNKAHFIMRYLRYFVFITKHGTYIDGFAGPQEECMCDTWAARLVLESEPRWMRHFHLCDEKRSQINFLEQLRASQPPCQYNRNVEIYHGDFNAKVIWRLIGVSAFKSRISRAIGIPLTKSGRRRKLGAFIFRPFGFK
jgi:hypothetical protein